MNNPIETNSFKHFFLVRGVKTYIIEPTNFDQSNFKVVQDDIARDTYYGNEESQLEFAINYGAPIGSYMNNDGVLINHLQSGVKILIEENKNYGNEADVKYGLEKNGVEFTTGNIDFNKDFETDNETYVKCRVIQNNNQALIKKREDIIIDLLSDKDLDDNTITPIPIQRMFLKAKPTYSGSKWENFNLENKVYNHFGQDSFYIPLSNSQLTEYAIDNSFVQFESYYTPPFSSNDEVREIRRGARMIVAKEDLSNIKIKINKLTAFINASGTVQCGLIIQYGAGYFSTESTLVNIIPNSFGGFSVTNLDYELTIPSLPSGQHIIISFTTFVPNFPTGAILGNATVNASCESIEITATSTAISSVINAVRWIDLIKQNYKAIGSLPVDAEKYDVGGEFYDNFLFTKNLIKQNTTSPFYLKLKDTKEHLLEQCAYAQINNDKIYIGKYPDFYRNVDMGGFLELPTYDSSIAKNNKYLVNKFVFGYEKFEQDRNERNTVDAIHTDSEWFPQAKNSINTKSFKLPFIRDPFSVETARKSVFSIKNNSDSTDDNIFIADITLLPPNSRNKFTRFLRVQTSGGVFSLLTDNAFSWNQLGFNVGDTVIINNASGVVLSMTATVLMVNYSGASGTGEQFITIDYPLTNVIYTNRTNEGLIFSENLRNSDNFGNLRYSIKRNIKHWVEVLATYGKFIPTKKIKNTYFKANGECTTQFAGEPLPIKEKQDILISDIASKKILNQDVYKTSVACGFEQAVQLLNDIQNVRGFIRVQNPSGAIIKGYIKEANYLWNNEELELELEVKNESDFLNVTFSGGLLRINEVGYDEKTANVKNYNIFNDFIQFYDNNSINLCNRTKFDKVAINGITYDNIDNLINAIESL